MIIAAILNGYAFLIIGLPLQSIMQLFFIGVGISGWKNWSNKKGKRNLIIKSWNTTKHLFWILFGTSLTLILFKLLNADILRNSMFESSNPFFDSLMFVFNIIPMYMTTKKVLESLIYFIWIDIISGCFYLYTGDFFYCFLFFFYIPFATHGFLTWKKDFLK